MGVIYQIVLNNGALLLDGSSLVIQREVPNYLCFTAAASNSSVTLTKTGSPAWSGSYSLDGETWSDYVPGTTGAITLANIGDKVYFKGIATDHLSESNYLKFTMTGSIAASGNIMSLGYEDFENTTAITYRYLFNRLFSGCTSLVQAPSLPAMTMISGCYKLMFNGCTNLLEAPSLPATSLYFACYHSMFQGCTGLTKAPALPATTLAESCYNTMFNQCSGLTQAPVLSAPRLIYGCYTNMFRGCSALVNPPALPATTLANYCYASMFYDCIHLANVPVLPVETLYPNCYEYMFCGCTGLTKLPALPATTLASACYNSMFKRCTGLYISDSSISGTAEIAWRIPTTGTFTNTYAQTDMFKSCLGTRSSDSMAGASGESYTYYTQNAPVSVDLYQVEDKVFTNKISQATQSGNSVRLA